MYRVTKREFPQLLRARDFFFYFKLNNAFLQINFYFSTARFSHILRLTNIYILIIVYFGNVLHNNYTLYYEKYIYTYLLYYYSMIL